MALIAENGFEPRIGRSVSLDHAAELLGVSRRTIYNRIREGKLLGRELDFFENASAETDESLLSTAATRFPMSPRRTPAASRPKATFCATVRWGKSA